MIRGRRLTKLREAPITSFVSAGSASLAPNSANMPSNAGMTNVMSTIITTIMMMMTAVGYASAPRTWRASFTRFSM